MRELPLRQKFAELLAAGAGSEELLACVPGLAAASVLEDAYLLLRSRRPEDATLLRRFADGLAQGREARRAGWQQDLHKLRLRLSYARTGAAAALLPGPFLGALTDTFLRSGLSLALGLEKRPRPMLMLGHPLPLGTEGLGEVLDAVLSQSPPDPDPLPALNHAAPAGLEFLTCAEVPDFASPVLELHRRAEWRWVCPSEWRASAMERVDAFRQATSFQIEKTGKEGGHKQVKRIEVRDLVLSLDWEDDRLCFETRIDPGQALHPAKLLGGMLGMDPDRIQGLVRTRVHLAADPRLDQAERFEPKIKNMFEDAVLLKAGPNLQVYDDDEGEPLRLG